MNIPSPGKYCLIAATIATLVLQVQPVRGETTVALQSHSERVEIVGRVATTTVSQTYVNYTRSQQEVVVRFRLPPGSAVDNLAMWVEGLRSPAVLHPRMAAKQIYREIRDAKRDPALLEYLGSEMWRLSVFPVLPNKTQKIEFKFTSVLGGRDGRCVYRGMKVVGGSFTQAVDFECSASIRYRGGIKDVQAVADALGVQRLKGRIELGFRTENRNIKQPAAFSFTPKITPSNVVAFKARDGRQYYASVLDPSWDTPKPQTVGRNIAIVLDVSASMKGTPFKAAAKTVQAILNDLTDRDKFDVIVAGSDVGLFNEKLLNASKDNKLKAVKWLTGFMPKGATDLAAALLTVESLNKNIKTPLNVFLISDGGDSVGARCAKKEVSPFLTAAEKLPNRPPANCRFFVCNIEDGATVLEFLAEATGGESTFVYGNEDAEEIATYLRPLLNASKIPDPVTRVTLKEIVAKDAKRSNLTDIGFSRPDPASGMVVTGPWPGPGKRTLEVTLHRPMGTQSTRYVLDFPKDPAQALDAASLQKVWAHQRADRMWAKLHTRDVKINEVQAFMDFSRSAGIITRAMAMLVLESDEDYIRRGIKRPGSSVTADKSLAQLSARKLLTEIVKTGRRRNNDFGSQRLENPKAVTQQARELQRRGKISQAARLFEEVANSKPGQFEARQMASLTSEYLALKDSFDVETTIRESNDEVFAGILAEGKWHEMVMQTEPTALALQGETAKIIAPPPSTPPLVLARKTPPPAAELQDDKLLARKIPKIDMKDAALKDVLAFLETDKDSIEIRWDKLAKEGIKPSTTISVKMQNVTLDEALSSVLKKASKLSPDKRKDDWLGGLDFTVDKGGITISSQRDIGVNAYLRTYDIQDLVAYSLNRGRRHRLGGIWLRRGLRAFDRDSPDDVFESQDEVQVGDNSSAPTRDVVVLAAGTFATSVRGPRIFKLDQGGRDDIGLGLEGFGDEDTGLFDPGAGGSDTGLFDPGAGGGDTGSGLEGELRSIGECTAEIKTLLSDVVDRDSWRDAGGEAGVITEVNGVLMIKQTRANHKAIAKVLDNLRDTWRKRAPIQIAYTPDTRQRARNREEPEDPFTAKGRINKWLIDLLDQAAAGKLSKFSSVRVEKIGSRTFARICGVWFDTSLTGRCQIHAVETDSAAHAALLNSSGAIKKCLALGRYVIVKADDTSAVYLNRDGISKADDKQFKKMIAALAKPPTKR